MLAIRYITFMPFLCLCTIFCVAVNANVLKTETINTANNPVNEIDVIAVEFPPFTTANESGNGLGFQLLRQHFNANEKLKFIPRFVPPARAQQMLIDGDWCLTFYPPKNKESYSFIKLKDEPVSLGFYRLRQDSAFTWSELSELKGKSVAVLRFRKPGKLHEMLLEAGMMLVPVSSVEQGLKMMVYGRLDLVFSTQDIGYLDTLISAEKERFQFSDKYLFNSEIGVYVNSTCQKKLG